MTGGGGGPKIKLNPKPKKIPILGQVSTLKNTYKIWYSKRRQCFSFSKTNIFKRIIALPFVIHGITHFTDISCLIYVLLNFTIYFTINAIVTLFTDVFKAILLVKAQTAPETVMKLNSYPKKNI